MPLNLFYTMVQKSQKWPQTQIQGGSCLNNKDSKNWITALPLSLPRFLALGLPKGHIGPPPKLKFPAACCYILEWAVTVAGHIKEVTACTRVAQFRWESNVPLTVTCWSLMQTPKTLGKQNLPELALVLKLSQFHQLHLGDMTSKSSLVFWKL